MSVSQFHLELIARRILLDQPPRNVAVGRELAHRPVEIALHPQGVTEIEMRHRDAKDPLVVVGIALGRLFGDRERFAVGGNRICELAGRLPDLAYLVDRLRASIQFLSGHRARGHGVEIDGRFTADVLQQIEPADLLQLRSQIAEHESDQVLGLPAPPVRVSARGHRNAAFPCEIDRVLRGGQYDGNDCRGDRQPPDPSRRLADNPAQSLNASTAVGRCEGAMAVKRLMRSARSASIPVTGRVSPRRTVASSASRSSDLSKAGLARRHLLHDQPERKHVARRCRRFAHRLLRAHVGDGSGDASAIADESAPRPRSVTPTIP